MEFSHKTTVTLIQPLRHYKTGDTITLTRAKAFKDGVEVILYKIPGVGFGVSWRAVQAHMPKARMVEGLMATRAPYALVGKLPGGSLFRLVVNEGLYQVCEVAGTPQAKSYMDFIKAIMVRAKMYAAAREFDPKAPGPFGPIAAGIVKALDSSALASARTMQLDLFSQAQAKPDPREELLKVLPTLSEAAQVRYVELMMGGPAEAKRA